MCLVGFASLQSLWAFISGVLALLAPPVASNLSIPTTIVKGQQSHCLVLSPLPLNERSVCFALSLASHYVLASLVKGEVLSPEKIRATTGGIAPYPHQSLLFPLIFAKEHLSLALLAPPVAPNTAIPRNHCKRTIIPRKSPSVLI